MERVQNSIQLSSKLSALRLMLTEFDWQSLIVLPVLAAIESPMVMIIDTGLAHSVAQKVPKLKMSEKVKLICYEGGDGGFVVDRFQFVRHSRLTMLYVRRGDGEYPFVSLEHFRNFRIQHLVLEDCAVVHGGGYPLQRWWKIDSVSMVKCTIHIITLSRLLDGCETMCAKQSDVFAHAESEHYLRAKGVLRGETTMKSSQNMYKLHLYAVCRLVPLPVGWIELSGQRFCVQLEPMMNGMSY